MGQLGEPCFQHRTRLGIAEPVGENAVACSHAPFLSRMEEE